MNPGIAAHDFAPRLTQHELDTLDGGSLLTTTLENPTGVSVHAAIDCPPSEVFSTVTRFEELPQHIFALRSAEVESREADEIRARFEMKLPFPVGRLGWTNHIRLRQLGEFFSAEWSLVSGDLKTNEGQFVVGPRRGDATRSLARFVARVETRRGLPKSAQRLATRWLLPKIVAKLRRVVEKS